MDVGVLLVSSLSEGVTGDREALTHHNVQWRLNIGLI